MSHYFESVSFSFRVAVDFRTFSFSFPSTGVSEATFYTDPAMNDRYEVVDATGSGRLVIIGDENLGYDAGTGMITGGIAREFIAEINTDTGWEEQWHFSNVQTSAVDLFNVMFTSSIADDQSLLSQMMSDSLSYIGLSEQDDVAFGYGGRDKMYGGGGNDTLNGGDGPDKLVGGSGDDRLEGANDSDELRGGLGNDRLYGAQGNDRANGQDGNDRLDGGDGNDRLDGDAGNDRIEGDGGSDHLVGDEGNDRLFGEANADSLTGERGDDWLFGGSGKDVLGGGKGSDRLYGGGGSDVLTGNGGDDRMSGGAGADVFRFSSGRDVITDFTNNTDTLLIDTGHWDQRDLSRAEVLDMARVVDGDVIFNFGDGRSLRIEGFTNIDALFNDLAIH